MFLIAFVMAISITTFIINKQNQAEDNESMIQFDRQQSLVILGILGVGILLEVLTQFIPIFQGVIYWGILLVYMIVGITICIALNKIREKQIQEEHEQIVQIFSAISRLIGKTKDIDFSDLPFSFEKDKDGKISKIIVNATPQEAADRFGESNVTQASFSLDKFFSYFKWVSSVDLPKGQVTFIGEPLPPDMAKWVGSDLRPVGWIPLGMSGTGEVAWNMTGPKDLGASMTIRDGERIGSVISSSAPQGLGVGSTGGGKSIWVEQIVTILDK